ncbi:hypothetical protein PR048_009052 [Dryococelus australis]|uniref:Uncharacterized protein n=1 Tax=Dryococelus australis TaxID=614101 RepID=A0ABQ9I0N5_9NEOP|nr:hypothetical protein PR048_009052 [Dryococelus australis]
MGLFFTGAMVVRWIDSLPPTMANRVPFPDDAGGRPAFSGISRIPCLSILELLHTHLASPSSALETSMLRTAPTSSLSSLILPLPTACLITNTQSAIKEMFGKQNMHIWRRYLVKYFILVEYVGVRGVLALARGQSSVCEGWQLGDREGTQTASPSPLLDITESSGMVPSISVSPRHAVSRSPLLQPTLRFVVWSKATKALAVPSRLPTASRAPPSQVYHLATDIEQHLNAMLGETGDPRDNPPTTIATCKNPGLHNQRVVGRETACKLNALWVQVTQLLRREQEFALESARFEEPLIGDTWRWSAERRKQKTPWPFFGDRDRIHEYPVTATRINCEAAVFPYYRRGRGDVMARLLASHLGFDSRRVCSRIFACPNHAARCHWLAVFFGDLPFPPPLQSSAAPDSPQFILIRSHYLAVKSLPNFPTHCPLLCGGRGSMEGHNRRTRRGDARHLTEESRDWALSNMAPELGFPQRERPIIKQSAPEGDMSVVQCQTTAIHYSSPFVRCGRERKQLDEGGRVDGKEFLHIGLTTYQLPVLSALRVVLPLSFTTACGASRAMSQTKAGLLWRQSVVAEAPPPALLDVSPREEGPGGYERRSSCSSSEPCPGDELCAGPTPGKWGETGSYKSAPTPPAIIRTSSNTYSQLPCLPPRHPSLRLGQVSNPRGEGVALKIGARTPRTLSHVRRSNGL